MTSYANDTTTSATTTTTSGATAAATTSPAASATTTTTAQSGGGVATAADPSKAKGRDNLTIGRTRPVYGEEDGNSSDGREKADTTPENIKKIAEIMEGAEEGCTSPTSPALSPRHVQLRHPLNPGFVGLGAAIDESSGKFCLGKPPPSPAERGELYYQDDCCFQDAGHGDVLI